MVVRLIVSIWVLLLSFASFAQTTNGPGTFSFEGQLRDNSGNPVTNSSTYIKFEVLPPSGSCVLMRDQRIVDLSATGGYFSVNVGSSRGSGDPARSMTEIFQNRYAITGEAACSYTPATGETRRLRIHISTNAGSTWETLTPDQVITSSPFTSTAESIQGYSLQNIALVLPTSSAPTCSGSTSNMTYFDSTTRQLMMCNAVSWVPVSYNTITGGSAVRHMANVERVKVAHKRFKLHQPSTVASFVTAGAHLAHCVSWL